MPYKDKDKERKNRSLYRKNNKEKLKENKREYYLKNKEKFTEKAKEHYKNNKDIKKIITKKNWYIRIIPEIKKRNKGIFDIDSDFLLELFNKQEGKCCWFGVDLVTDSLVKHPFQPSVDRLDNSKGYVKSNVVISSLIANFARNDFDQELWKDAIDKIRNIYFQ